MKCYNSECGYNLLGNCLYGGTASMYATTGKIGCKNRIVNKPEAADPEEPEE
jgi:hypothetical protein